MPIRYTKDQALALAQDSHDALDQILGVMTPDQLAQGQLGDEWRIKDVLAHVTFWENFLIGNVSGAPEAIAQRRSLADDEALNRLNAATLAAHRDRPVADLLADYRASFQRAIETIAALSDDQYAEHHNLIAYNTYDHYLEHARQLSAWVLAQP